MVSQCMAPSDEISSCDALLRLDMYRVCLIMFAILAIVGNALSFVLSVFILKGKKQAGYTAFVTHLCVSDFLMGVYLVMIGAADRIYKNSYLWEDTDWKHSVTCSMAGFLSLLFSEMSASIICLITLDRFIVVRFPLDQFRFQLHSAQLGCLLLWTMGLVLAAVPLLPASWHFYSQTAICILLPVTRQQFPGQGYAFAVMIILNFILFLLITDGQLVVYIAIRSQSMAKEDDNDRRSKDLAVAKRLFTVVLSDFLCWFPIDFQRHSCFWRSERWHGHLRAATQVGVKPFSVFTEHNSDSQGSSTRTKTVEDALGTTHIGQVEVVVLITGAVCRVLIGMFTFLANPQQPLLKCEFMSRLALEFLDFTM